MARRKELYIRAYAETGNKEASLIYATRNGNDVVTEIPIGMTLPGKLTRIGTPRLPFANAYDHSIGRVVEALAAPMAA